MPDPASAPASPDLFELDDTDRITQEEDGLDLEAYLDLEESPEITRLMREMRGASVADAVPPSPATLAASADRAAPASATAAARAPRAAPATPPAPKGGIVTAAPGQTFLRRAACSARPARQREAVAAGAPRRAAPRGERACLDLAAVARALGVVRVQARHFVVACPRCEGRASIVICGDRFKCFGCEAAGDEAALTGLLTGWDARRVGAWLDAAQEAPAADDPEVRRPWRLSLFAR